MKRVRSNGGAAAAWPAGATCCSGTIRSPQGGGSPRVPVPESGEIVSVRVCRASEREIPTPRRSLRVSGGDAGGRGSVGRSTGACAYRTRPADQRSHQALAAAVRPQRFRMTNTHPQPTSPAGISMRYVAEVRDEHGPQLRAGRRPEKDKQTAVPASEIPPQMGSRQLTSERTDSAKRGRHLGDSDGCSERVQRPPEQRRLPLA